MTLKKIIIAAVAENRVIGKDGKIPWRIPEDMRRFKNLTTGQTVIMGRKTYESIPKKFRPLPDRTNLVLTAHSSREYQTSLEDEGVLVVNSMEDALSRAERFSEKVYFAGGSRVYEEALDLAEVMELTRIHRDFEGNAYFPRVDWSKWRILNQERVKDETRELDYSFLTYGRI